MQQKFVDVSLLALGMTMLSCQLTLMYVFVGGSGGNDARTLLLLQAALTPVALLVFFVFALLLLQRDGWKTSLRVLWEAMPAWIVLALVVLNLLVVIGEMSLLLRERLTAGKTTWFEHAPLLCVLSCSLAFIVLYERSTHAHRGSRGRW